jgi:DNA-binding XRE family transcriptional regulator
VQRPNFCWLSKTLNTELGSSQNDPPQVTVNGWCPKAPRTRNFSERVILSCRDFDRLVAHAEDNIDAAAVDAYRRDSDAAMAGALTGAEFERILAGAHPLVIWRDRQKLSRRALANRSGVDHSLIAQIERGAKTGSTQTVIALAAALGVTAEDITPMPIAD